MGKRLHLIGHEHGEADGLAVDFLAVQDGGDAAAFRFLDVDANFDRQVCLVSEIVERCAGNQAAFAHDGDAVGSLRDFGQEVRRQENGGTRCGEFVDHCVEGLAKAWVQAAGGLVEEEEFRLAEQGLGKTKALTHAFGVGADALISGVGEADLVEECYDAFRIGRFQAREQGEGFAAGHRSMERDVFREEGDVPTRVIAARLVAENRDVASGRRQQPEDHL